MHAFDLGVPKCLEIIVEIDGLIDLGDMFRYAYYNWSEPYALVCLEEAYFAQI